MKERLPKPITSKSITTALCAAWLACSAIDTAYAQIPTVRFASEQVFVSQRNGSVSVPLVIESSSNIEGYFTVGWTTNSGTARDRTHYGDNSPYNYDFRPYGGSVQIYPNQSARTINIPIHYTATKQDHSFSVLITETNTPAFVPNGAIGVPSVCIVTIRSAAPFIASMKAKIAKIKRKIKIARKTKNPVARAKKIKRLNAQKAKYQKMMQHG